MEARKPVAAFDFNAAAGGAFRTSGGKDFFMRLWFWISAGITIVFIVTLPFLLRNYGDFLEFNWRNLQSILGSGEPVDPSLMWPAFAKILPAYIIFSLGLWVVVAAGETAFYRKYFHDNEAPRQPLRFGRAELRTMLIQLGVWGSVFGAYFLGVLALAIIAAIFGAISPIIAGIFMLFGVIAVLVLLIMIPIRLAPAAALSVRNDKTHVWGANKVTKFRFWSLFIAYLVTYIGGYILYYLIYSLAIIIATGDPGFVAAISGLGEENPRILFEAAAERFKSPLYMFLGIVAMIMVAAVIAAWVLLVAGVNAYAVRWWNEDNPLPKFE